MNEGAAKAARQDMKAYGVRSGKVPRAAKKLWASLNHRQRGKLQASWVRLRPPVARDLTPKGEK